MATTVGHAQIEISPELNQSALRRFEAVLRAEMRRIERTIRPEITIRLDSSRYRRELQALTSRPVRQEVNLELDSASYRTRLQALTRPVTQTINANLEAGNYRSRLQALTRPTVQRVDAQLNEAGYRGRLQALTRPVTQQVNIRLDETGYRVRLQAVTRPVVQQANLALNEGGYRARLQAATRPVTQHANLQLNEGGYRARLQALTRPVTQRVDVDVDASALNAFRARVAATPIRQRVVIDVDRDAYLRAIRAATADIQRRMAPLRAPVDVDRDRFHQRIRLARDYVQRRVRPVEVNVHYDRNRIFRAGQRMAETLADGVLKPMPGVLAALRTGVAAVFASPIGIGFIALGVTAATQLVAGFLGSGALAALGGGIIALGALALRENERLRNAFTSTASRVSNAFAKAAQGLVKPFVNALNRIGNYFQFHIAPKFEGIFDDIAPAIAPLTEGLLGALGKFIDEIAPHMEYFVREFLIPLAPLLVEIGQIFGEFIANLMKDAPAMRDAFEMIVITLRVFMNLLLFIIILSVRSLSFMLRTGKMMRKVWDTGFIQARWQATWEAVRRIWNAFYDWLKEVWISFRDSFAKPLWDGVKNVITFAWNASWESAKLAWNLFRAAIVIAWNIFLAVVRTLWGAITTAIRTVWNGLWTGARLAWQLFWTSIQASWAVVRAVATTIWTAITTVIRTLWNGLWTAARMAWQLFWTAIQVAWNTARALAVTIWTGITTAIRAVWNALWTGARATWNAFWTAITTAWNALRAVASAVWNGIRSVIQSIWTALWNAARTIWNGFRGFIVASWNSLRAIASTFWNGIRGLILGIWQGIWNTARTLWNGFNGFIRSAWSAFRGFVSSLWNGIRGLIVSVWRSLWNTLRNLWNAFNGFIRSTWVALRNFASTIWNGIRGLITSIWRSIWNTLRNLWNSFSGFIRSAWNSFRSTAAGLWNSIRNQIANIWRSLWSTVSSIWNSVSRAILNSMSRFRDGAISFFRSAADGIRDMWSRIREFVAAPVRFVVNTVWNDGVGRLWGAAKKVFTSMPDFPRASVNFATGGIYPGYTPGRDIGVAAVSGGEAIMRPEWTRAIGAKNIHEMNRIARTKGVRGIREHLMGDYSHGHASGGIVTSALPAINIHFAGGYEDGGIIPDWVPGSGVLNDIVSHGAELAGRTISRLFFDNPVAEKLAKGLEKGIDSIGKEGEKGILSIPRRFAVGIYDQALAKIASLATPVAGNGGDRGVGSSALLQAMIAFVRSVAPGASVSSGSRPGDWGYHGRNRAIDIIFSDGSQNRNAGQAPTGQAARAAQAITQRFMGSTLELIWDPLGNRGIWNGRFHRFTGPTAGPGTHNDHIHWAFGGTVEMLKGGGSGGGGSSGSSSSGGDGPDGADFGSTSGAAAFGSLDKATGLWEKYKEQVQSAAMFAGSNAALVNADGSVMQQAYAQAKSMGASNKVLLALFMAGFVESGFRNLNYGDRDSVGFLQQRPSQGWGSVSQIMNVPFATRSFVSRAMAIERRNPGIGAGALAQAVQRSAFPGRYEQFRGQAIAALKRIDPKFSADTGGYLPVGTSVVYNGTGKAEAILTSRQWAALISLATEGPNNQPIELYATFMLDGKEIDARIETRQREHDKRLVRAVTARRRR